MISPETSAKLAQPLSADAVRTREQAGQRLSYVDGHHVVSRANEVFGHDGWGYTVRDVREVYRGERPGKDSTPNLVIVYEALVRVEALGVAREDVGIGQCDASPRALAQGIEKGRKEAVTDALKRALRTFGPSFGLALYDKEQRDVVALPPGALDALDALADCTDVDAWVRDHKTLLASLSPAQKKLVSSRTLARRAELSSSVEAHAELDGAELEAAPEQDPEALQAFFARVAEIELPGEGVSVWMKHRGDLGALDPAHREVAWKALCKRIEDVGKMVNAKVWLKKAIAEEDARRGPQDDGPRGGGAPAPQASANTNATGSAAESAPAAGTRSLAAVPSWAVDDDGIRWHLSTKKASRALENSVRLHGKALAGTSYLHLAAERLCALSPADEHDTRLSVESARRRVDGWAEAGPCATPQPTARAV